MKRVVITGMGAVTPIGNNVDEFWQNLINGTVGISALTRFDNSEGKAKVAAQVKNFNPLLYFEKNALRKNDLFTQYAVGAACDAVKQSQIEGKVAPERFGVYVGSGIGGIHTTVAEANKLNEGAKRVSPFMVPMMIGNMAAGTISMRFKAEGPVLPIVTACASATHSIGEAFHNIAHGYSDAIIAGGSEAAICPLAVSGFTSMTALSTNPNPATASIPFDKRRDGFVIGEGAAVVVLEEFEHAKKRGATVYGEVIGYGNTSDAHHITSPHPEGVGIIRAIKAALDEAKISPDEKTYINAHGTSTPPNDKVETFAFKQIFGGLAYKMPISSTKSMTGHMLGAAGGVEAIACLLAMKHGIVPPTMGYAEKDPDCDLNYTPNVAVKRPLNTAISTSLGFGGHNACLVFKTVEE